MKRARITDNQRFQITKLVQVLTELRDTPEAAKYDHSDVNTCTIGFAVKSGQFEFLNKHIDVTPAGHPIVREDSIYSYMSISAIAAKLFGSDYDNNVVFGGGESGIFAVPVGVEQLDFIIKFIVNRYKIEVTAPKPDATKVKVQAVIDENVKLIDACNVVLAKGNIASVVERRDTAIIENRLLRQFV